MRRRPCHEERSQAASSSRRRSARQGRKNHYEIKTERGAEVAALFYSLIETATLRGQDPGAYLLRAAIENSCTVALPTSHG